MINKSAGPLGGRRFVESGLGLFEQDSIHTGRAAENDDKNNNDAVQKVHESISMY